MSVRYRRRACALKKHRDRYLYNSDAIAINMAFFGMGPRPSASTDTKLYDLLGVPQNVENTELKKVTVLVLKL